MRERCYKWQELWWIWAMNFVTCTPLHLLLPPHDENCAARIYWLLSPFITRGHMHLHIMPKKTFTLYPPLYIFTICDQARVCKWTATDCPSSDCIPLFLPNPFCETRTISYSQAWQYPKEMLGITDRRFVSIYLCLFRWGLLLKIWWIALVRMTRHVASWVWQCHCRNTWESLTIQTKIWDFLSSPI